MHTIHDTQSFSFASDNYAGMHPRVLAALAAANQGHLSAYGEDVYTQALQQKMQTLFGESAHCFPVFNGTGANVTALQAMLPRWGAVICAETAHINCDEGIAPEYAGGVKLLPVPTPDGKLTPGLIDQQAWGFGVPHRAQPGAVYISQTTELGTCYSVAEIKVLADHCHQLGMMLYMDGARLANAVAALSVDVKTMTTDAGVDMLSFGGTKNGMMLGECVLTLNPSLAQAMPYLRKINSQLGSKMRFISAQFLALLEADLWLELARHSNAMAQKLYTGIQAIPELTITQLPQANAVFAQMPLSVAAQLHQQYHFYDWNQHTGEVRWMTSFDTTEAQVEAFVKDIQAAFAAAR
ncbi:low specificity L-threonine aldolase [Snodgrassella sp. CFCC 13594]|uniref:threonine aldolase family protein n=1 Tax=Snodgrassella sp. CFCC 13594 TaxID=1775559 RepID=UPI000836558D|nr:low specificity L-threonine aldolase [Snodgrassella sp. CFCC 13594]